MVGGRGEGDVISKELRYPNFPPICECGNGKLKYSNLH